MTEQQDTALHLRTSALTAAGASTCILPLELASTLVAYRAGQTAWIQQTPHA